ncbi:MAG: AHH domain-containing protein [Sphingorhabdus sp.]
MATNEFGRGNENPQFHVKGKRGWFFSPGKSERTNIFQGHHINPNNIVDRSYDLLAEPDARNNIIARLFSGLKSIGYDQADPDRNRVWLPTSDEDALRLGVARHDTNHAEYDRFMSNRYEEIGKRADERIRGINYAEGSAEYDAAKRQIYLDTDKDMAGLQQWIKKALATVDENGRGGVKLKCNTAGE